MDNEKFSIEIDGVERVANVIKILELDNREFVVYSVDNGNETSDVLYSEIVKDAEGFDTLVDVNDNKIREKILELVNVMMS